MAQKNKSTIRPNINYPKEPLVKYVKKASMWCKTWFEADHLGKYQQKQAWFMTKAEAEA